jgi:hypothetical protein
VRRRDSNHERLESHERRKSQKKYYRRSQREWRKWVSMEMLELFFSVLLCGELNFNGRESCG